MFPCLISNISVYYAPKSDIRVKSYDHLNFSRASVVQFRASRYIMGLNHTPESKVMAVWICRELSCSITSVSIYYLLESDIWVKIFGSLNFPCRSIFHFKCLDILCTWVGNLSEKLWPFEFLKSFRYSILSVSIYLGPQSYTRVKRYDRWNMPKAYMFNFERLDILFA